MEISQNTNSAYFPVSYIDIDQCSDGQRVDNFLFRHLKHIPKGRIYKMLRQGEVRVNKKRVKPSNKLVLGDRLRIPPIRGPELSNNKKHLAVSASMLAQITESIFYEDDNLLIIDKPAGIPVHGGSSHPHGVIEILRAHRPKHVFLELVHRLDKDTSGILLLAKTRPALLAMHNTIKQKQLGKYYYTLVRGEWKLGNHVEQSELMIKSHALSGKKVVTEEGGKLAESIFKPVKCFTGFTLLSVQILTGRMHQIRTQLAHLGYPVIGDNRYGDFELNRKMKKNIGLKRLFLHAYQVEFRFSLNGQDFMLERALPETLAQALTRLQEYKD